jgi:hypothetical protein
MAKVIDRKSGKGLKPDGHGHARTDADGHDYKRNPLFLGEAFNLYCRGVSLAKVAVRLKPEWPDVTVKALQRIAAEQEWRKARAEVIAEWAEMLKDREILVPQMIGDLKRVKRKYDAKPFLNGMETHAYTKLIDMILGLQGQDPRSQQNAPIVVTDQLQLNAFVRAIEQVLGPQVLKSKKALIKRAFDEEMEKARNQAGLIKGGKGAKLIG